MAPQDPSAQLVAEEVAFSTPMHELDRKRAHFRSANIQRSRDTKATIG